MLRLKSLCLFRFTLLILLLSAHSLFAAEPLLYVQPFRSITLPKALLVGGGRRPLSALQYLKSWSVGKPHAGSVLVVTWASSEPDEYFAATAPDFKAAGFTNIVESVRLGSDPVSARQKFLVQLSQSETVFFTGGDQIQFIKVAQSLGVISDLQNAYKSGKFFSGSSAGTAVMSHEMFSGEEDLTKITKFAQPTEMNLGVGFFDSLLIDQHFVKRMRWARLFSALLSRPEKNGLGVDEDTAVALETDANGDLHAQVFGDGTAVLVQSKSSNLKISFYQEGEKFKVIHSRNSILR